MTLAIASILVLLPAMAAGAAAPDSRFQNVNGATLSARLDAAIAAGHAARAPHFWAAYAFDVRPGVAVDVEIRDKHGSVMTFEGVSVSTGTVRETRNLGVFLLYGPDASAPERVEVYNLDRVRDYEGYPVFWMDRAANGESLNLLEGLLQTQSHDWVAERLVLAIAIHDGTEAADLLERAVRTSHTERARDAAILWLGQVTDRLPFLADLVRGEGGEREVRKQAALSIGVGPNALAVSTLRTLYDEVRDTEVRKQILLAVAIHDERGKADEAVDFLIGVASNDANPELKKQAIFWLSQKAGQRSLDTLTQSVDSPDDEVKQQAVFAISQRPKDEAIPILIKLAKTHPSAGVRKQAVFWLGQIDDERVLAFFKELFAR